MGSISIPLVTVYRVVTLLFQPVTVQLMTVQLMTVQLVIVQPKYLTCPPSVSQYTHVLYDFVHARNTRMWRAFRLLQCDGVRRVSYLVPALLQTLRSLYLAANVSFRTGIGHQEECTYPVMGIPVR